MTCCLESFIRTVLLLLILLAGQLQEIQSGFAEKRLRIVKSADMDLDPSGFQRLDKNLAASPDDINHVDQKDKCGEDDKAKHFGYDKHDGPGVWAKWFLSCRGHRQSPVELDTTTAVTLHHPRIMWWNYSLKPRNMTVSNNGHTVLLTAQWGREEDVPYHWSASTAEEYVFQQLHFHWGQDDHSGSEHTLNNERFALEMHVVHSRRGLISSEQDDHYNNQIRVIGIFFRISDTEHNNTGLQRIVQFLPTVKMADTTTLLPEPFSLSRLVPEFSNLYLTYNGSLTTPPCTETVSWVIRKEPLTASRQQVEEFRNLMGLDGQTIKHNWRPTQPLNGRIVIHIR